MRTLTLLGLVLAATACEEQPLVCTDLLASSVSLTVESADGLELENIQATFTAGNFVDEPCDVMGDANNSFVCGWEVEGPMTIQVSADGHESASVQVDVDMSDDGCHVVNETVLVELDAVAD